MTEHNEDERRDDNIVTTHEDLSADQVPRKLLPAEDEGYRVEPIAAGRVTGHELLEDVDGNPLGVEHAGSVTWMVGDVIRDDGDDAA